MASVTSGLGGTNHNRNNEEQDAWILEDKRKRNKMGEDQISHGFRTNRGQVDLLGSNSDAVSAMKDGRTSFQANGGQNYVLNPDTNRYVSHTNSNDYYSVNPVENTPEIAAPVVAAVEEPTPLDWREDIDTSQSAGPEGMTTSEIVDNTGMDNWMASGPETQGQHINALVDPASWQTQIDPRHQQTRNLGRYINPLIDEEMEYRKKQGLLSLASNNRGLI